MPHLEQIGAIQVDVRGVAHVLPVVVRRRTAGEVDAHEVVEDQRRRRLGELLEPAAPFTSCGANTLPSFFHLNMVQINLIVR